MSISGVSKNDQMPVFAFNRLVEVFGDISNNRVVFLGVSYRGDVGDTRFTPVDTLVRMVRGTGAEIVLHDPFVSYWEEQKCAVRSDLAEIIESNPELIIISAGHSEYKSPEIIQKLLASEPTKIYDTIGLLNYEQIAMLQEKHIVSVLGRGDI